MKRSKLTRALQALGLVEDKPIPPADPAPEKPPPDNTGKEPNKGEDTELAAGGDKPPSSEEAPKKAEPSTDYLWRRWWRNHCE